MDEFAQTDVEGAVVTAGRFELVFEPGVDLRLAKLPGVGPKTAQRLEERGIRDVGALLLTFPRKYRRVWRNASGMTIAREQPEYMSFVGAVEWVKPPSRYSRAPLEVAVKVDQLVVRLIWFNMPDWFPKQFERGKFVEVEGAVDWDRGAPQLAHAKVTVLRQEPSGRAETVEIEPVYTSYEGVKDGVLRAAIVEAARRALPSVVETIPEHVRVEQRLMGVREALVVIHQLEATPVEVLETRLAEARRRLVYEEFFTLQVELARRYAAGRRLGRAPRLGAGQWAQALRARLPFELTAHQVRAIEVLAADHASAVPSRRLLQGDVGSGKTIVALMAALNAAESGYQTAFLAPTEVLATQHFERSQAMLAGLPVRVALLKGSTPGAERTATLKALARGEVDILFGTHAMLSDDVVFAGSGESEVGGEVDGLQASLFGGVSSGASAEKAAAGGLGLVVIDEQHKFGVEQRDRLLAKGTDPHLLAMTATPIPRSLAHAFFGDLDLVVISEKPAERVPIRTILRPRAVAEKVHSWVREKVEQGEQAYYIYPLVEASSGWEGRANVVEEAEKLANGALSGLKVGVLHGRMSSADKDAVMRRFAEGAIQVLCATTVVEVGVDVRNASLMIIDGADVFGLSQLHQLRGRVGRGDRASFCVLLADDSAGQVAWDRLESFVSTTDGFKLAEIDLAMRGPGLFLGSRQAGAAEFRFADVLRDAEILDQARRDARRWVLGDAGR